MFSILSFQAIDILKLRDIISYVSLDTWIHGYIDAEGVITCYKNQLNQALTVSVTV